MTIQEAQGTLAKYGKFRHVNNYIVMAGKKAASQREESKTSLDSPEREQARTKFKADDLDERVGYYGEQLVLLAQTLGLNTYFEIGADNTNFDWV